MAAARTAPVKAARRNQLCLARTSIATSPNAGNHSERAICIRHSACQHLHSHSPKKKSAMSQVAMPQPVKEASSNEQLPQLPPQVHVLAMPTDANPNGDIFSGWLLSNMDLAGGG